MDPMYRGMFLVVGTIVLITLLAILCGAYRLMRAYRSVRKLYRMVLAEKKELEIDSAQIQEINNLLMQLFHDFVDTKSSEDLVHKASIIRGILIMLERDHMSYRQIQHIMTSPERVYDHVESIFGKMQGTDALSKEGRTAYERFIQVVENLEDLKDEAYLDTSKARRVVTKDRNSAAPMLGHRITRSTHTIMDQNMIIQYTDRAEEFADQSKNNNISNNSDARPSNKIVHGQDPSDPDPHR